MTATNTRNAKSAKKQKQQEVSTPATPPVTPTNSANLERLSNSALACFQHIVKRELFFHSIFFALLAVSLITFLFFFSFLSDSFLMGIFIACFFFAFVLYFVLKIYFQEQKPRELLMLRDGYLKNAPTNKAEVANDFAKLLDKSTMQYFELPQMVDFLRPSLQKILSKYHWRDVHLFKELFLRTAVDEKVKAVKAAPTEKASHAELATSYMALAEHFQAPLEAMNSSSKVAEVFWENFQTFARLAIEELLIVKEYAPNDLWACTKLAECYLALGMLDQAIIEYETILEKNPEDPEALFSLGTLYFKQGLHGKGLKIYAELHNHNPSRAVELISLYGSHDSSHFGCIPPSTPHIA